METITSLDTLYLHITRDCNLQCSYCYLDDTIISNSLTTDQILTIKDDLNLLRTKRLIFTGGEPLLRADTLAIAQELKSYVNNHLSLCLNSNGTLINKDNSKPIVQCFDEVRISIDGFQRENDLLRGAGSFDKAMAAFKHVMEAEGDPIAFVTVSSLNIHSLKRFMEYLLNSGICKIHVSPLRLIGRARDKKDLLYNADEIRATVREFWHDAFGLELTSINSESAEPFNCFTCKHLNIYPDGSVYPCHVLSYPELCLGNIRTDNLSDLYCHSELLNRLRSLHLARIFQDCFLYEQTSQGGFCLGSFPDGAFRDRLFTLLIN